LAFWSSTVRFCNGFYCGLNVIGFDADITGVELSVNQDGIVDWMNSNDEVNDI